MSEADRSHLITRWTLRSSPSEQDRMERAERMVINAIEAHPPFKDFTDRFRVYAKGSYANETNVRQDSDVDVVVENADVYYSDYVDVTTAAAATPDPTWEPYVGPWKHEIWRTEVENALQNYFGAAEINTSGEVAITIAEKPGSRPSADVVPAFDYVRYDSSDRSVKHHGSKVFKKSGGVIVNYPKQQIINGREKERRTGGRYKNFARALKNGENALVERGVMNEKPSYLMECLAYNVPDADLTRGISSSDWFQWSLATLHNSLLIPDYDPERWVEPNELKYLFGPDQKWKVEDSRELTRKLWEYLEYQ